MSRRALGCSLLGVCVAISVIAGAEEPAVPAAGDVALEYQLGRGAEKCPDEQAFRDAVAAEPRMKGADPFVGPGASASFRWRVQISAATSADTGAGFVAELTLDDQAGAERGRRTWKARTCREVVAGVAFTLGGALEPFPAAEAPSVRPAPPPTPPPPRAPVATAIPKPPPAPPPSPPPARARPKVQIGAAGLVAANFAPSVALGFSGLLGVRAQLESVALSVSVEGRADLESRQAVSVAGKAYVARTGFGGGSLVPCVHGSWLLGCGVLTIGAVRGGSDPSATPAESTALHVGTGLRGGLELPVTELLKLGGPPLLVQLTGELTMNVLQTDVTVDDAVVWHMPEVSQAGAVRLVALF
jgi:hypothetical protein